jgi:hypothetical protein
MRRAGSTPLNPSPLIYQRKVRMRILVSVLGTIVREVLCLDVEHRTVLTRVQRLQTDLYIPGHRQNRKKARSKRSRCSRKERVSETYASVREMCHRRALSSHQSPQCALASTRRTGMQSASRNHSSAFILIPKACYRDPRRCGWRKSARTRVASDYYL